MRLWISTCFVTALIAASAAFAEPPASDGTKGEETANAEVTEVIEESAEKVLPDCDTFETDEEKAKCLEAHETAAKLAEEQAERKGGKAQRSNTNRMEADNTDE